MSFEDINSPKRIVTGQAPDGTSYFARVEQVERRGNMGDSAGPDFGAFGMWGSDSLPVLLPTDGTRVPLRTLPTADETPHALSMNPSPHPGLLGFRANLIKFPPSTDGKTYPLHWHDTCDLLWIIRGELTVGLDGGEEATLYAGDLLVQNGTNHWWKAGADGCWVGLVMLGAKRMGGIEPPAEDYVDHSAGFPDDLAPMLLDRIERGEPNVRSGGH